MATPAACWYLPAWFGVQGVTPRTRFWGFAPGVQGWFAGVLDSAQQAVFDAFGTLIFFCLARMLVRNNRISLALTALFLVGPGMGGGPFPLAIISGVIVSAVCLLALLRFGLLSFAACLFVYFVLIKFPRTLDLNLWYSSESILTLFVVLESHRLDCGDRSGTSLCSVV